MSAKYIGKVENLITFSELVSKTGYDTSWSRNLGGGGVGDQIAWLKYETSSGRNIYIAERVLTNSGPSWYQLGTIGLIRGKTIDISGIRYQCRVLSGGNKFPIADAPGGEYDEYRNLVPSLWWETDYTICKEYFQGYDKVVTRRGSSIYGLPEGSNSSDTGWRPVLEQLDYIPEISITDQDLGDITSFSPITYSVKDFNTDEPLSIEEKIGYKVIRTLTQQLSGTSYTLDISNVWEEIPYGKNTLVIKVTDSSKLTKQVSITFRKMKEEIIPPILQPTLKQQVAYNEKIQEEIQFLAISLRNNLKELGINVNSMNKMRDLINQVGKINIAPLAVSGVGYMMYPEDYTEVKFNSESFTIIPNYKCICKLDGSYRVRSEMRCSMNMGSTYGKIIPEIKYVVLREDKVIYESSPYSNYNNTYLFHTVDIPNIKKGDCICVSSRADSSYYGYIRRFQVSCNLVFV